MKVYSPKDRIKVKLTNGLTFTFAPLTAKQKAEVMNAISLKSGEILTDKWAMVTAAVKYSVKGVEGLEKANGSPAVLEVVDGALTDDSLDLLLNIGDTEAVFAYALQLVTQGALLDAKDPSTGAALEVEVIPDPKG